MIAKSLEDALHNAFRGAREDRVATVSVARLIVEVLNNVAIDRSLADHGVDADGLRSELEHRRDLEPREQGPDGEPVDSNPSPALEALVASAMACAGKIRAKGAATNADLLLALFDAPEQQELVGCLEAFALTRPVALEMVNNPELRSGLNRRVLRPRVGPDTTNAAEGELASLLSAHKASGNKTPLEIVDKQFAHAQVVLSVEVDFALHFRQVSFKGDLSLCNCKFAEEVLMLGCSNKSVVSFEDSTFRKRAVFEGFSGQLRLNGCVFGEGASVGVPSGGMEYINPRVQQASATPS
ncbi:MAG: hypothetical protein ACOZJX_09095 [Pseudomonadota bacterium]